MGVEDERQGSEVMRDIKYGGGLSRVQEVDVLATQESNKRNCVKDKREGGREGQRDRGDGLERGKREGRLCIPSSLLEPRPHDRNTCLSWPPAPTGPWTAQFSLGYRTFTGHIPARAPCEL